MVVELSGSVDGIHGGDDRVDAELGLERLVSEQGMQDGRGIREPGGLDERLPEGRNGAGRPPLVERNQAAHEVVADGAAQAAGTEEDGLLVQELLHEQVVDADFPELVHEHRGIAHFRMPEQRVEQGGLAASEKAGDDGNRGLCPRHGWGRSDLSRVPD